MHHSIKFINDIRTAAFLTCSRILPFVLCNNMKSVCAKSIGTGNETEKMADAFAAYFLMPRAALADKADKLISKHGGKITLQDIIRIEQYFGVSHQTAVYQLNNCGYINREELDALLNISVRRQAEAMAIVLICIVHYLKKNNIAPMVIILTRLTSY